MELRGIMEQFVDEHPEVLELWDSLGAPEARGTPEELLEELRGRLAVRLKADAKEKGHAKSLWRVGLVEGYIQQAADPEKHLPVWLREGAPIGVKCKIASCNIFPKVERLALAQEELQKFYARAQPGDNYKSMKENRGKVDAEL